MNKYVFLLLSLLLVGCYQGLPGERPASSSEVAAIHALEEAWAETHPDYTPGDCEALRPQNVFVWVAPQRLVALHCSYGQTDVGILACVESTYQHGAFTDTSNMRISWDAGWNLHHRLVIHEAAHSLAGCEYGYVDRRHEISDVWEGVTSAASGLFFERYPIAEHQGEEDPYEIEGPPWDLCGTHWEDMECEVYPESLRPLDCP